MEKYYGIYDKDQNIHDVLVAETEQELEEFLREMKCYAGTSLFAIGISEDEFHALISIFNRIYDECRDFGDMYGGEGLLCD